MDNFELNLFIFDFLMFYVLLSLISAEIFYHYEDNNQTIVYTGTGNLTAKDGEYAKMVYKIVISEGIINIESHAFHMTYIPDQDEGFVPWFRYSHVELPNSLEIIDDYAFGTIDCNLTSVHFPETAEKPNLKYIGTATFLTCNKLTTHNIPGTFTYLGDSAFCETKIDHIELSEGMTAILGSTFKGTNLVEIRIPSTVTRIEWQAFQDCKKLTVVEWPAETCTHFGQNAFLGCSSLIAFKFPDTASGLDQVGKYFEGCTSLKKVQLPRILTDTKKRVGEKIFNGCTSLSEIIWPENIEYVGDSIASGTAIEYAVFPSTVTYMGASAFNHCPNLRVLAVEGGPNDSKVTWNYNVVADSPNVELIVVKKSFDETKSFGSDQFLSKTLCYYGITNPVASKACVIQGVTKIYLSQEFVDANPGKKFGEPYSFSWDQFDGHDFEIIQEDKCRIPPRPTGIPWPEIYIPTPTPKPTSLPPQTAEQTPHQTIEQSINSSSSGSSESDSILTSDEITIEITNDVDDGSDYNDGINEPMPTTTIVGIVVGSIAGSAVVASVSAFLVLRQRKSRVGDIPEVTNQNQNKLEDIMVDGKEGDE
ncbi:hypothetical protein TRFO_04408 [Tritrichomonas foetus]|uniref:Surface antigen BspA-like n=1 Tax=Tritrichomonas foetus TaxID=1144522 RepID=A0A1J4KFS9_9EUKA|nr:hypothetical protein TRFO_04408 [Tritrichomonas foetus]|eukprot:OHT09874.1 hypothetical protein TRFO_04408 [Tritrichomonas foetus]